MAAEACLLCFLVCHAFPEAGHTSLVLPVLNTARVPGEALRTTKHCTHVFGCHCYEDALTPPASVATLEFFKLSNPLAGSAQISASEPSLKLTNLDGKSFGFVGRGVN